MRIEIATRSGKMFRKSNINETDIDSLVSSIKQGRILDLGKCDYEAYGEVHINGTAVDYFVIFPE